MKDIAAPALSSDSRSGEEPRRRRNRDSLLSTYTKVSWTPVCDGTIIGCMIASRAASMIESHRADLWALPNEGP
jgi:hypothetical protein